MGLYAGNDILLGELIIDIQNIQFGSSAVFCALFKVIEFLSLTAVNADTDDVKIIVFFEPRDDGSGIEAAAVGEDYFFFLFGHCEFLHFSIFIALILGKQVLHLCTIQQHNWKCNRDYEYNLIIFEKYTLKTA